MTFLLLAAACVGPDTGATTPTTPTETTQTATSQTTTSSTTGTTTTTGQTTGTTTTGQTTTGTTTTGTWVRAELANVLSVSVSGQEGAWVFAAEVLSPDVDCSQYADWWELVAPDGSLVYRRILNHSHATEQPFVRAGDPVDVDETTVLVVRAHLHPAGYGGQALRGSLAGGFTPDPTVDAAWHADLAERAPLPTECWY